MARRPGRWATLAAACALACALAPAAAAAAVDPVHAAAERTAREPALRVAYSLRLTAPGHAPITVSGTALVDLRRGAGSAVANVDGYLGLVGKPVGRGPLRAVFVAATRSVDVDAPYLRGRLPAGKPWVRLSLSAGSQLCGVTLGSLVGLADPAILEPLLATLRSGGRLGSAGGTVRYRAVAAGASGTAWIAGGRLIRYVRVSRGASGSLVITLAFSPASAARPQAPPPASVVARSRARPRARPRRATPCGPRRRGRRASRRFGSSTRSG